MTSTTISQSGLESFPYSSIGLVKVFFPDGTSGFGTFSVVGRNDILTATHVIYDPDFGGLAERLELYFAADYDFNTGEFSHYAARIEALNFTALHYGSSVFVDSDNRTATPKESERDIALIGIKETVGDFTGWLDMIPLTSVPSTFIAESVGYSAQLNAGMLSEHLTVTDSLVSKTFHSPDASLGPGSSGGPLLVNNQIIGVKSSTDAWADLASIDKQLLSEVSTNDSILNNAVTLSKIDGMKGSIYLGTPNVDTITYSTLRDSVTISQSDGAIKIYRSTEADTLINCERVIFLDTAVAFDITDDGVAGRVSKILGAVFGRDAVKNKEYAGIGVSMLDSADYNYESLIEFALRAAGARQNGDVVDILYENLVGRAPEQNVAAQFVELLDTGEYTWGQLGVYAADLQLNKDNIDLIGLATTGLEFTPFTA